MFCFPRGVRLKRASRFAQPAPSAFNFVFTENDGRHVFVACLMFYEQLRPSAIRGLLRRYRSVQSFGLATTQEGTEEDNDEAEAEGGDEGGADIGGIGGIAPMTEGMRARASSAAAARKFGRASHFQDKENMRVWVPHW